jgi:hypothetical protein
MLTPSSFTQAFSLVWPRELSSQRASWCPSNVVVAITVRNPDAGREATLERGRPRPFRPRRSREDFVGPQFSADRQRRMSDIAQSNGSGANWYWFTGYAEAILTSKLGDWIVSQLPTICSECSQPHQRICVSRQLDAEQLNLRLARDPPKVDAYLATLALAV